MMKNTANSIITYKNYGTVYIDIKTLMNKKNITTTQMVKRTGLHNQVVEKYYNGTIERLDKGVSAKICFVLDCDLSDILYYKK